MKSFNHSAIVTTLALGLFTAATAFAAGTMLTKDQAVEMALKVTRLPTSHPDRIKVSLAAAMPMANARTFCIPSQMALGPG
jgi:hypothetical protein